MSLPLRAVLWIAVSSEAQAAPDKVSLDAQEAACRAAAEREGLTVVRVLRWDGYTRWESDVIAALDDFAAQGRLEYHTLRDLWRAKSFDVLVCYQQSRLGRSFTLQSWVVENVIRSGARIYRVLGGWITAADYGLNIAMGGYTNTQEVEGLVARARAAREAQAARGLHTAARVLWFHREVRDGRGRRVGIEIDEAKRRLFDDLAALVLAGKSWRYMEVAMYERGHAGANGKPYHMYFFQRAVHHPAWWGHRALYFNSTAHPNGTQRDLWVLDAAHEPEYPLPDGVKIFRDVIPPVWTGALADAVKGELRRRRSVVRGRAHPEKTRRFSGLLVCATCGHLLSTSYTVNAYGKKYGRLECRGIARPLSSTWTCTERKGITHRRIEAYLDPILRAAVELASPDALFPVAPPDTSPEAQLQQVETELATVQAQIARLIERQAAAPPSLHDDYAVPLEALAAQRERLQTRQRTLQQQQPRREHRAAAASALEHLRATTVDRFWQQSDRVVHQTLAALLGNKRLVVEGGRIVGYAVVPPRAGRFKKSR